MYDCKYRKEFSKILFNYCSSMRDSRHLNKMCKKIALYECMMTQMYDILYDECLDVSDAKKLLFSIYDFDIVEEIESLIMRTVEDKNCRKKIRLYILGPTDNIEKIISDRKHYMTTEEIVYLKIHTRKHKKHDKFFEGIKRVS